MVPPLSISLSAPSSVEVRLESDSESEKISLLIDHTWSPPSNQLPPVVSPLSLSLEWQWYLFSHIREYCPEEVKDIVCPQHLSSAAVAPSPSAPCPTGAFSSCGRASSPAVASSTAAGSNPPQSKRAQICSKCHQTGHNVRTCRT